MFILSIVIFFLLGLSVVNLISKDFSRGEKIGYSLLVGIPLNTFFILILSILGIRTSAVALIIISLLLTVILNIKNIKPIAESFNQIKKANLSKVNLRNYNFVWLGLILISAYIAYGISAKNLYWPTFAFDSIAGYDLMGKVTAAEGTINNSLFDETGMAITGSAHRIIYPPMVAGSFAIAYMNGLELPKVMITLFFVFFFISLYFLSKKYNTKTGAAIIVFLTIITPEMTSHAALSLINLPQAVFVGLGYIALWIWISSNDKKYLILSAVFLAINVWTRSDGIVFNFVAGLVVLYFCLKQKNYKDLILFGTLVLLPFVTWYSFMAVRNIKAAVPNQQLLVTHLFWDSQKLKDLWGGVKYVLLSTNYYGAILYLFFGAVAVNIFNIYKKQQLPLLFLIIFSWLTFTFFYYQIDYSWDSMQNVISYSYKRAFFCFVPMLAFYIASNKLSLNLLNKFENYITGKS
ncbi:MAG: hypothetical protein PVH88_03180 [Ignavibacteria bacterium]|jgi:hypothetical protein